MQPLPDRIPLSLRFDPTQLKQDLERLEQREWIDHFVKQNYSGTWDVLPLRGTAGATHPIMMIYSDPSCVNFEDTPFLKEAPYLQEVLAAFQCPLQSVRLMRLTPGSEIKEHCDHDLSAELGQVRMHIPITTNPDVDFFLNGTHVPMTPGSCWYLRLADPHAVNNRGTTDRVHLVIDATMNEWLTNELHQAANK
jgi:hypothetical protein